VAFARALVMNPRVVLADEPTGNLDPRTAGEVGDLLLRLNADAGTALILVTHNHELARRLAKTCSMNDGVLEW
jgi:lipoprotein-releasing system ATP-binding protein